VNRIYTLATDRGVQIGIAAPGQRGRDDDMPAYVEQAAIVGPLVCVYAYAPQAERADGDPLPPEYQCFVLAVSELRKHPALAALLGMSQPSTTETVNNIVGEELRMIGLPEPLIDQVVRHVAHQAQQAGAGDVAAFANAFMQQQYRTIAPLVAQAVAHLHDVDTEQPYTGETVKLD
jgi:hypothetical protein